MDNPTDTTWQLAARQAETTAQRYAKSMEIQAKQQEEVAAAIIRQASWRTWKAGRVDTEEQLKHQGEEDTQPKKEKKAEEKGQEERTRRDRGGGFGCRHSAC